MGDFTGDKNQPSEEKRSIFDSIKFWGHRPMDIDSLNVDIEKDIETSPTINLENIAVNHTPEAKQDESHPSNIKLYETISGNFIITRGWDGNNMLVYKTRRKNY